MRSDVLLLALISLSTGAHAQVWQAVVYSPAPGLTQTYGMGAGERAFAGFGLPAGTTEQSGTRAVLFQGAAVRDVTPPGFLGAFVRDSFGRQHVGGAHRFPDVTHAFLWNGAFAVDLHSVAYRASEALGTGGGYQAGFVETIGGQRLAALWHGSAGSLQLLDSTGYALTRAEGTDGVQHVGWGAGPTHALLWNGLASPVVLHPGAPYVSSRAVSVDGGAQAGHVLDGTTDEDHAAVWFGTAASFRDLNPAGYRNSRVHAVRGGVQVGQGQLFPPGGMRALAWLGDAASVIDLHALLPAPYTSSLSSSAEDINARGDVVGYVSGPGGVVHPVVWFR